MSLTLADLTRLSIENHEVARQVIFLHDRIVSIRKRRCLVMLILYLDDSGSQDSGTVFVMGGFIASEGQWKRFDDQWNLALKEVGIPMFHAMEGLSPPVPNGAGSTVTVYG